MTITCKSCGTERDAGTVCRPCANRRSAEYKARNAEKLKADSSAYKKRKHAEGAAERLAIKLAKQATVSERRREARRKWKAKNRHKAVADCATRSAAKIRATPLWADRKEIDEAYRQSRLISAEFAKVGVDISFHVDHIVPLRGKTVCGLHAGVNLRVTTDIDNMRKGNRDWPDSPESSQLVSENKKEGWEWIQWAA